MTMLDDRARLAVDAIERSVADHTAGAGVVGAAGFAAVKRRHAMWAGAGWAFAGSAAAATVVVAAMFTPAQETDVATTIPEPTVVTTEAPVTETTEVPVEEPIETPVPVAEQPTTTQAPSTTEGPTTTLDTIAPELAITSPSPEQHFEENVVTFSGTTEPGATVVAGGKFDASVDGEGRWSIQLVLSPGANGASFAATDSAGNQSTARITVHYDPPAPPTTTEPPGEGVEFTANNTFGSCEENPPYDIYYGTADPETKVTITSEFGSATVYANGEGDWSKQVFFPEAPYGETFLVTVKDHTGAKKYFEFVSWAGA
jgi:hypothetical protein